jgi:enoyl-CoA hydratase
MIDIALEENICWLTISRPQAANALDAATQDALLAELGRASTDENIAAVVLRAAGERVFCAGADLKEFSELDPTQAALERRDLLLRTLIAMLDFPKPLVAAVHAPAVGAGAMLALACDEIVMADNAWLAFPEIALDLPTPMGAAMIACRTERRNVHMLVQHGHRLSAFDACSAGLIDDVVAPVDLASRCVTLARECAPRAGHAYAVNKRWMNRELRQNLIDAAEFASANFKT